MKLGTVFGSLIQQKQSTLINIPYYDCKYTYILHYGICLPVATFHDNPSVPFQFKIAESHYGPAYTLGVSFAAAFDSWERIFYFSTVAHTLVHALNLQILRTSYLWGRNVTAHMSPILLRVGAPPRLLRHGVASQGTYLL